MFGKGKESLDAEGSTIYRKARLRRARLQARPADKSDHRVIPTRERSEAGEPALSEVEGNLLLVVRDALAAEVCLHQRNHFFRNVAARRNRLNLPGN
jgi:hypothetical protein